MTERDIFLAALELTDPAARAAYVARACGDNPALRAEVEELLRTHDETSQFLETPAAATNAVVEKTVIGDSSIEDDDSDGPPSDGTEFSRYLAPATRPGWIGRLGHYEIEQILGRGAFGIVAKAFDDKLHRVVAIKFMNPTLAATSPPRKRFLREARTAAAVTHENIVAIYAVEEEPIPYLVMEYIPGQTLQQRMDANGPFDIPEILKLGRQIASGLAAAHAANLIHRDIKPANILLTGGTNERAKISDFGLARAVDDASLTSSGLIAGTPMYMSPEQARGETLDHRTDLFSLGSVLYQMTSGRPPFRAANTIAVLKRVCEDRPRPLDDVIPETPAWLSTIIFRLMEKDPGNRYQSADEVAELLERCETELRHHGRVTSVFMAPETQVLKRESVATASPRRKPLTWLIAGVTALVMAAGFIAMNGGKTTPELIETTPVAATILPLPTEVAVPKPSEPAGWHGWPADAPKPAIAPFDAEQAKKHQEGWAAYLKVPVEYTNSIGMKFRLIPPGEFLMGSTPEEIEAALKLTGEHATKQEYIKSEGPQHRVILRQPLYFGITEVTQSQYERAIGTNPSHFSATGDGKAAVARLGTSNHPVEMVSWNDAAEFCTKLSQQEKLNPFYFRSQETVTPLEGTGYRLPTEAEWEYACRAGTITQFWNGTKASDLNQAGWYDMNSGGRTHAVGELPENPFGLSDVHGNVWEWVQDGWDPDFYSMYQDASAVSPYNPFRRDSKQLIRGGNWSYPSNECSSTIRAAYSPQTRRSYIGFRVALTVDAVRQALSEDGSTTTPSLATGWHGLPADAPKPAIAPFDADRAKKHQEEWAAYLEVPVEYTNSIGMKFRLIPPGEFLMGSTSEEIEAALKVVGENQVWREQFQSEAPHHKVVLTEPVYAAVTEVTQSQYEQVMGMNPSHFSATGGGKDAVSNLETINHPVEMVSWNDAAQFCAKLSQMEKLEPFYFRTGGKITSLDGTGYRLPTEAEWEYACRAGTTTRFWSGNEDSDLESIGWFGSTSGSRTHFVGELMTNPFGLSDMHGNVWEVVQDGWDTGFYGKVSVDSAVDPLSPFSDGAARVIRGGDFNYPPAYCRSSTRSAVHPSRRNSDIGFRVVLPAETVKTLLGSKRSTTSLGNSYAWHGWPADAPKPAIAPFDAAQAKQHQEAWAKYLGVPVEYENSIGMKFRLIPPGEFLMGSTPEEIEAALPIAGDDQTWQDCIRSEGPLHKVTLTQPFYLATHEVTQSQFQQIMEANPSRFAASGEWADSVKGLDTGRFPVESVEWGAARQFCQRLAKQEGLKQTASATNGSRTPFGIDPYRLPAEAEWEFACRAGTTSQFSTGDTSADLTKVGCFNDNSSERTHATGELAANSFGLHDMHGNVWEWVLDSWRTDRYAARSAKPVFDPFDPMTKESEPLTRGGNWSSYAEACRSASRCSASSAYNSSLIGFRVAMSVSAVKDQVAKKRLDLTKPAITSSGTNPAADREAVLAEYYAVNRRAAEKALSVGGSVLLERLPDHEIIGLRAGEALPDGPFLVRIWSVFNSSTVTNADLDVLRGLRHIREISASAAFNRLDAAAIPHIAAVRAPLQFLSFHHAIKTSDLAALPTLEQLTFLWVLGHDVDDDWTCLEKFPHLRTLNINRGPIPSLASLSKYPQLRSLALTVDEEPDLAVLPELQRQNPRLRVVVQVGTNHRVVGQDPLRAAVPDLLAAGLPLLAVRFDGTSTALSKENVEKTFDEGVMSVKLDAIPASVRLSDPTRDQVTLLVLQRLEAAGHQEADLLAVVLADRHDMQALYLQDSDLTDTGLKKLESLIGLQYLDISGTKVTEEGVKAFRAAVPGCILRTSTGTLEPDYAADPAYPGRPQTVSQSTGWNGWPADAPPPAIAPFDAEQAKKHQEQWAAYLKVPVEYTNSIGMKFRLIPPGEFLMGGTPEEIAAALEADLTPFNGEVNWWSSCLRSEGPRHRVRLTRPFYLGAHEVTQRQYQEIIGENPSENSPTGSNRERVDGIDTANFPVEFLSWHDAVQFCNRLNEREQRTNRHLTTMPPTLSDTGTGYRLPTEAEWEFACRAGTTARYWTGHDVDSVLKAGWFQVNDGGRTHAVGELLANPFGLFDVHGNAWEWTADGWDESWYQQFADKLAVDPVCPLTDQPVAMMKAGTWPAFENFCRAASRIPWPCDARNSLQGMRVTLSVEAVRESLKGPVSSTPAPENLNSYFARNRRAAEKVLAFGGEQAHVVMEIQDPYEWRTLRPGEPLPDLPFVVREWSIKGSATAASDDLEVLAGLQHVLSLNLATSAPLDAQCIPNIAALSSSLKELVVANNNIRTSDLGKLPPMPCTDVLWILGEQVDDDWKFLKQFPALRYLEVYGASFPALGPLGDSHHLRCVRISGGSTAPDAAQVADAQTRNPHLRLLFEADGKLVLLGSDPAIQSVQGLVKAGIPVEALSADGTVKTLFATTMEEIQSILAIRYIVKSIPRGVVLNDELRQCLADVDLSNVKAEGLTDADSFVQRLIQRQDAEHLDLTDSDLTDDGLRLLGQHAGLRSLAVKGTRVTADGTAAFHRAVPGCHVYADNGDLPPEILLQAAREPKESEPDASPTR